MKVVSQSLRFFLLAAEILCASLLFLKAYRKRSGWIWTFLMSIPVFAMSSIMLRFARKVILDYAGGHDGEHIFIWSYCVTLIFSLLMAGVVVLFISAIFTTTVQNTIFIAVAALSIRIAARSIFFLVCAARGIYSSNMWQLLFEDIKGLGAYFLVYGLVCAGSYLVFIRGYREIEDDLIPKSVLILIVVVTILDLSFSNVDAPKSKHELYIFLLLSEVLITVLTLTFQFFALGWLRMKLDQVTIANLYQGQKRQFELSKESMEAVNIHAHDLKHKVNAIMAAMNGCESERMCAELCQIEEAVSDWDNIYYTGCEPLDIVLTEKARICRRLETELAVVADGNKLNRMKETDIYSLFSNALDNAIEAVSQIPKAEKRLIMVTVAEKNTFCIIQIENTFRERPLFINGILTTSKEDALFHGFGVKSIENVAKKYEGYMDIAVTEELFQLKIVIPCYTAAIEV